jgi:anti-sigma factor RsiW
VNQEHLTDEQLQDYLDGNISKSEPIAVHLENCPGCQQALRLYEGLRLGLEKEMATDLAPDFADAVMDRLPEKLPTMVTTTPGRFQIRDSLVFFIAAVALISTGLYFVGADSLLNLFSGGVSSPQISENRLLTDVGSYLSDLNISTMTILFAVLSFAGIGIIDRVISRRRQSRKPVSFLV